MSKRKHAEEIKKWADNKNAVAWFFDGEWKVAMGYPLWHEKYDYKTILPEYAEAWQAFLDGALQIYQVHDNNWVDCGTEPPPLFDLASRHYRRKPKPKEYWLNLDTHTWNHSEPIQETQYKWLLVREVTECR